MKNKKIDFETFRDSFLYCFCFKQVKRPSVSVFLKLHFKVYTVVYEKIYSVQEYAENVVDKIEMEEHGMILKNTMQRQLKKRGGKRPNSGRKKGIETTTMRVPLCLKEKIKQFIKQKLEKL